jgi:hypothetical protein
LAILGSLQAVSLIALFYAMPDIGVRILPLAQLIRGGEAVLIWVTVSCYAVGEVLEAFVNVHQDVFGMGGIPNMICDGLPRLYSVRITALGGSFYAGWAFADSYVSL